MKFVLGLLLLLSSSPVIASSQKCDNNIVVTMERETCFGDCPAYSVQVYSDGTVIYVGKVNVKEIGEKRFKISQETIQAVIKEFQRINYFSLKDRYDVDETGMSVTDQPTTTTSICLGGKRKRVVDYYFAPKELVQLEDRIDSLLGLYQFLGPL